MKKVILCVAILTAMQFSKAQTYLIGGLNVANITKNSEGKVEDNNALLSFNAGFLHRFDLSKVVDIETGLSVTGKGSKAETNFTNNDYVKSTFNPVYLEVPLNAVIKVTDIANNGIFFHAGPYIAMGIAGKSKTESRIGVIQSNSSSKIEFSNDNPFTSQQDDANYNKLKRFDYGLNAGVGISFSKALIRLNYGLGLAKINSTQSNNSVDEKNKYRVVSLNIAFKLN
ncbi:MAG: PorT family protein [Ferruginibacter sp.]|nr:PorT family protein [Ferruginibacter sp.]